MDSNKYGAPLAYIDFFYLEDKEFEMFLLDYIH